MTDAYDWMKKSVGVSFHWTPQSVQADGRRDSYEQAVDNFNVGDFAASLAGAGVNHCIFTLAHAKQYLALPNAPLEKLLPGRTTGRDLIGELADALTARNIRFIAYYNHSCNGDDDTEWKKACGYADGVKGDLDSFAKNICDIVSFIADRYGKKLSGWWFDSAYSLDPSGPFNTVSCDMGDWRFPWEKLTLAAKSGNTECAVCFNSGVGSNFMYAPHQDYYAGESVRPDEVFSPDPLPGIVEHRWICMDNPGWMFSSSSYKNGFAEPLFSDAAVAAFIRGNLAHERMTTFNLEITQAGAINPCSLKQFSDAVRGL